MAKWRPPSQPIDYEVGYGRPPKSTRFKPGQSGNPKGRPRQQKTLGDLLQQALSKKARIQENGVTKFLTMEEIGLRQLANKVAKGDLRAMKLLYDLKDRYQGPSGQQPFIVRMMPEDKNL